MDLSPPTPPQSNCNTSSPIDILIRILFWCTLTGMIFNCPIFWPAVFAVVKNLWGILVLLLVGWVLTGFRKLLLSSTYKTIRTQKWEHQVQQKLLWTAAAYPTICTMYRMLALRKEVQIICTCMGSTIMQLRVTFQMPILWREVIMKKRQEWMQKLIWSMEQMLMSFMR